MKSRSLDFTVCTTKCTIPCWRKLTIEKEEWDYDDTCSGLSYMFNIEPVKDWTKSLIEVGV